MKQQLKIMKIVFNDEKEYERVKRAIDLQRGEFSQQAFLKRLVMESLSGKTFEPTPSQDDFMAQMSRVIEGEARLLLYFMAKKFNISLAEIEKVNLKQLKWPRNIRALTLESV